MLCGYGGNNGEQIAVTILLISWALATVSAQEIASPNELPDAARTSDEPSTAEAGAIVFSNLHADGSYNIDTFAAKPVAGRPAGGGQTERWDAVRFIPKLDVQVNRLSARRQ